MPKCTPGSKEGCIGIQISAICQNKNHPSGGFYLVPGKEGIKKGKASVLWTKQTPQARLCGEARQRSAKRKQAPPIPQPQRSPICRTKKVSINRHFFLT